MSIPAQTSEVVQAASVIRDAQLHLFGINSDSQPTVTRYPKPFNPIAMPVWKTVLESEGYALYAKVNISSTARWTYCVKEFLKACATQKVYPFAGKADFETSARAFLTSARKSLVGWFKQSGIFDVARIKSVTRSHSFTQQNFSVEVCAELRPISDPTFIAWLTQLPNPGFRKVDSLYRRSIQAHIDVEFEMRRGVPYLTYRIFCHTPVRILNPGLLGRNKLSKFVDDKLWTPLIKEHPVEGLGNRRY